MTNPICPKTGVEMFHDTRPLTLTYKGESITFDMPGWYCDKSNEGIHSGEDMKVSDRVLNRLKARVEGILEPEEIRRIRKKLNLTQKMAGMLIGGGPRAFQKYESGDLLPSRAINSALLLLDNDPSAFAVLNKRQGNKSLSSHNVPNVNFTVNIFQET
ncbi:MAG: type II toxin-antitoxin system MqsA family antitoxin [Desulfobacterales bacterium]|nr:type II toxin-antitoxin system MqsA family antitoxin [Desulfobacterales bacterium]